MVIRVALVLSLLAACVWTGTVTPDAASARMLMPASGCGQAPAMYCGPAVCGPPNPLTCCGALFAGCVRSVGACLEMPSIIMAGLLAPPRYRRACRPPVYGCAPACYPVCPPPACPPQHVGITKCKPAMPASYGYPAPAGVYGVRPGYYKRFRPGFSGGYGTVGTPVGAMAENQNPGDNDAIDDGSPMSLSY